MTKIKLISLAALIFSNVAHAGLINRGNGMLYDDVLDITWLQDANYAYTSGYASENKQGSFFSSSTHDIKSNGRMGWDAANNWADQLVYEGFDDWRLTTADPTDTSCDPIYNGYGCISQQNELSYMFYINLGLHGIYDSNGATDPEWHDIGGSLALTNQFNDAITGEILQIDNLISSHYWTQDEYSEGSNSAFNLNSTYGSVTNSHKSRAYYAWAVRDGDILSSQVSKVPEPTSLAIFCVGMLGLAARKLSNPKGN